ncbi:Coiled-coil domain-containing protein [Fasciola hepatica]|uniref:Coiled-coil domain-containing protein n=1 Tax=Fasciola hepatica TaxID=6192 RepID=A0A4E0RBU3_FASHE|nr:Coiled-coil domain-containing protein [Fasciola hepatica]
MDPRYRFRHIKQINLEEVAKATEEFRLKSKDIEAKILALSEAREKIKNTQNMTHLVRIWKEERNFLRNEEQGASVSLRHPSHKWISDDKSIIKLSEMISQSEEDFQNVVIKPLQALREDLRIWLQASKNSHCVQPSEPVKRVINEMNQSLVQVEASLKEEEASCQKELPKLILFDEEDHNTEMKSFSASDEATDIIYPKEMGIPDEAWDWESPSEDFLTEMLAEFIKLDKLFFEKLEHFQNEYNVLKRSNDDKWTAKELEKIEYFSEVFKRHGGLNRKKLCIDFLGRIMENRKPSELERVLDKQLREKQLRERMHTIRRSWTKAREDLSVRIRAALLQATEMAEQKRLEAEQQRTQREICLILREQVRRWREEKAEMNELEEHERANKEAQEEATRSAERLKQEEERRATKAKVTAYKNMKVFLKQQEEQKEAVRLALLRDIHAKQARIDMARLLEVEKKRILEVQRRRILAKEGVELSRREREKRLESLREKVRPAVSKDHERAISETKSWRQRLGEHRQETQSEMDITISQPIGRHEAPLNTFSDAQLYADRRTRLTAALHAAGVLDSNYARALLATISSTQPTRRDNVTSESMKEIFSN